MIFPKLKLNCILLLLYFVTWPWSEIEISSLIRCFYNCICKWFQEYPDYYEIIKKPIDMQRIQQKIMTNQYDGVDDMVADFVQMFDNACRYNEPDSLIYKVRFFALHNISISSDLMGCIQRGILSIILFFAHLWQSRNCGLLDFIMGNFGDKYWFCANYEIFNNALGYN